MKKVSVLFILALFVFGQTNLVFAHDRHHRGHHGHHRWNHHDDHHHGHYRHRGGRHHGHFGHRYHHRHHVYDVDGTALVIGTAVLGVSLVKGVAEVITSPFTTPFTEGTKRLALTESARTERESIRSNTVLNAPGALEGNGSAEYVSTEGAARISASTSRPTTPCADCREVVRECSKEQLKEGRAEWGTFGKLKNLKTGESCYYDLR